jgi:hypothetical protein
MIDSDCITLVSGSTSTSEALQITHSGWHWHRVVHSELPHWHWQCIVTASTGTSLLFCTAAVHVAVLRRHGDGHAVTRSHQLPVCRRDTANPLALPRIGKNASCFVKKPQQQFLFEVAFSLKKRHCFSDA